MTHVVLTARPRAEAGTCARKLEEQAHTGAHRQAHRIAIRNTVWKLRERMNCISVKVPREVTSDHFGNPFFSSICLQSPAVPPVTRLAPLAGDRNSPSPRK
jgi:hypothetical protein